MRTQPIQLSDSLSAHLLPDRAVWLPDSATLCIADPHFGKGATFRARGVPVPRGTSTDDFARLTRVLQGMQVRRLIVLGDLLHARDAREAQVIQAGESWREQWPSLEVLLVRGNHDLQAGDPPPGWGMRCVDEPWCENGLAFRHFPRPHSEHVVIAGHTHPAARVRPGGGQQIKLPAFHWDTQPCVLTLPAFGSFVDHAIWHPGPQTRVFVTTGTSVFALTP